MNVCEGGCIYSLDTLKTHGNATSQAETNQFKAIIEGDDRIMIIPVSLHKEILERGRSAGAPRKGKH